ncbi:hypothetical protein GQ457_13G003090 [Hibiscus cannabinus]
MAKNRNKKKRNGVTSMDVNEGTVPELHQAMDTSETGVPKPGSATPKLKMKGRPMKRSKNVRKAKAAEKAIAKNEKYAEKSSKIESKKSRIQSAKVLYD